MEEMRLMYHKKADGMLYPNLKLPEIQKEDLTQVGKYGIMAAEYLKENDKVCCTCFSRSLSDIVPVCSRQSDRDRFWNRDLQEKCT